MRIWRCDTIIGDVKKLEHELNQLQKHPGKCIKEILQPQMYEYTIIYTEEDIVEVNE